MPDRRTKAYSLKNLSVGPCEPVEVAKWENQRRPELSKDAASWRTGTRSSISPPFSPDRFTAKETAE